MSLGKNWSKGPEGFTQPNLSIPVLENTEWTDTAFQQQLGTINGRITATKFDNRFELFRMIMMGVPPYSKVKRLKQRSRRRLTILTKASPKIF